MGDGDFARVHPHVAFGRGHSGAFRFERQIALGMQLPLHLETGADGGDGNIHDRRVGRSEHVVIEDVGQRIHADGNFSVVDRQREGLDVVEHGEALPFGGYDQALQLENVDGNVVGDIVHHIAHVHLDRRRCAPLLLRGFGQTRASCGAASHRDQEQHGACDAIHDAPP